MKELISFELNGRELDDGRTYLTIPTIKGFHYILEAGEEVIAVSDTLKLFMAAYLNAEIEKVRPATSPNAYRERSLNVRRRSHRFQWVAEAPLLAA